nr:precorrin-6y C5,15-methyltransferase (decarboxylating) subunit CbiE [uncultured Niameybacter sp.]
MRIKVIGMGPGHKRFLTLEGIENIRSAHVILGAKRLTDEVKELIQKNALVHTCTLSEMENLIESHLNDEDKKENNDGYKYKDEEEKVIAILASGDTGFFSIAKWIKRKYEQICPITFVSGISSLQYFCNQLHKPYEGIYTMSVHGRENHVLGEVLTHKSVFVLTGGTFKVQDICRCLTDKGLGHVQVYIGENLSYETEKIETGIACDFVQAEFSDLAVILIERGEEPHYPFVSGGLRDEVFIRGPIPMTKEEVRAVVLSKLQLLETDCVYDIGAGTGSVALEIARLCKKGYVYALEKNQEAISLIKKNKEHLGIINMEVCHTNCPEGMEDLPTPQKVFIGGSGKKLKEILKIVLDKNPKVHIVITALTLETLQEALVCKELFNLEISCSQISVANSKEVGSYHMLMGQNPIFILTLKGREHNE